MRVKLVSGFDLVKLEKTINDLLETLHNHKIVDIKLFAMEFEKMATKYAMVIYD